MKNFIQPGDSLTVSAPYAVTSGQGVLVGALFGIAAYDAASSTTVEIQTEDATARVWTERVPASGA